MKKMVYDSSTSRNLSNSLLYQANVQRSIRNQTRDKCVKESRDFKSVPLTVAKEKKLKVPSIIMSKISISKNRSEAATLSGKSFSRCQKHSPMISLMSESNNLALQDRLETEARLWNSTFKAMGQLSQCKDTFQQEKLYEQPYHCSTYKRNYQPFQCAPVAVRFGNGYTPQKKTIIDIVYVLPEDIGKASPSFHPYNLNFKSLFETVNQKSYYLPLSLVQVHWSQQKSFNADIQKIWTHLSNFGLIAFIIPIKTTKIFAVFESLESAHKAVTSKDHRQYWISWGDIRFTNLCHYFIHKDYTLEGDRLWQSIRPDYRHTNRQGSFVSTDLSISSASSTGQPQFLPSLSNNSTETNTGSFNTNHR